MLQTNLNKHSRKCINNILCTKRTYDTTTKIKMYKEDDFYTSEKNLQRNLVYKA